MTSQDHHALVEAENDQQRERQDRDFLGQVVREAWVRWAKTQPSPKPSWLVPYNELSEADKEADRQIGEAVVALTCETKEKAEADARAWCRLAHTADKVADAQKRRAEKAEELADKYKWQVRDTCARAEKAEEALAAVHKERDMLNKLVLDGFSFAEYDGIRLGLKRARDALEAEADHEMSGAIGCSPSVGSALERAAAVVDYELSTVPARTGEHTKKRPTAWMRRVYQPATPNSLAEHEVDLVYGDDRPDGKGWVPLYKEVE